MLNFVIKNFEKKKSKKLTFFGQTHLNFQFLNDNFDSIFN